ncbi:MAG: sensor histidine kinase [Halanaerobiaceae bacterium]
MDSFFTWRKTISGRLTIIYVLMFLMVLLLLNIAVYLGLRYYILNNSRQSLDNTLQFLTSRLIKQNYYDTNLVEEISQSEQNVFFRILSTNREVRFQSKLLEGVDVPVEQGYQELEVEGRHFVYKTNLLLEQGVFIGYLQAVREISSEYRFLRLLLTIMSIGSLVGVAGAFITGYTVTHRSLYPIKTITATARDISGTDISKRLKVEGPDDELTELASTFNSMLDRLEKAFSRQRQFVSDASHELRTPISVVQGYINLLDRWGKNEEEVREEAIQAIKHETSNMKSLVEGLLFLARGDDDRLEVDKKKFPVHEIVNEVLQETEMITKKVKVYSRNINKSDFYADPELIKQMLRSFVDNSIKYTPAGGEIIIDLIKENSNIKFVIEDTGVGIPEEDIPHIFERFYRVDKSRSDKKGTGLGLAIAKWIIDQHRGEVKVESSPGEGTKITVFFPVNQD